MNLTANETPGNMNIDHIAYLLQRRILDEKYKWMNGFLWNILKNKNGIRGHVLLNKIRKYNLVK